MGEKEAERRRADRTDVSIWVEERTKDALYFQRAKNLSPGGLFLENTLPHPAGTRVVLDFDLPGDGPIRLAAEVVSRIPGEAGMGMRFVDVGPTERKRLSRFVGA